MSEIVPPSRPADPASASDPDVLEVIAAQLRDLRFGVLQLTVHDGRVVQIERIERTRLSPDKAFASPRPTPSAGPNPPRSRPQY